MWEQAVVGTREGSDAAYPLKRLRETNKHLPARQRSVLLTAPIGFGAEWLRCQAARRDDHHRLPVQKVFATTRTRRGDQERPGAEPFRGDSCMNMK